MGKVEMTPSQTHEIHLQAVAGCALLLAQTPKCKIAARELVKILRTEQLKLTIAVPATPIADRRVQSLPATPETPQAGFFSSYWKNLRDFAVMISSVTVFWAAMVLLVVGFGG